MKISQFEATLSTSVCTAWFGLSTSLEQLVTSLTEISDLHVARLS